MQCDFKESVLVVGLTLSTLCTATAAEFRTDFACMDVFNLCQQPQLAKRCFDYWAEFVDHYRKQGCSVPNPDMIAKIFNNWFAAKADEASAHGVHEQLYQRRPEECVHEFVMAYYC